MTREPAQSATHGIAARLAEIRARVSAAIQRRGPGPEVTLIGVSKRQPVEKIRAAYDAGLRDFGENYAQEFRDKLIALADLDELRWHYIGALQSNKIKYVAGRCLVHTLDNAALLAKMDSRARAGAFIQDVLVEVNFEESQKAGISAEDLPSLLDHFTDHPNLRCVGLMVIPPPGTPETTRGHFARLRRLRDSCVARRQDIALPHLSMGMSADFEAAIEEGATLIRVGTAIFGGRPPRA